MYHKILVPVDRSDMSKLVFAQGLALAQLMNASVMLVHALSSEEEGYPILPGHFISVASSGLTDSYLKQLEIFEQQGLEMLKSLTEEATATGVVTEFTQNTGSPGRVICNLANSWGADLILMGRRGHSDWSDFFLGSVSNYVLHHAPCSVLVVHPPLMTEAAASPEQPVTMAGEEDTAR